MLRLILVLALAGCSRPPDGPPPSCSDLAKQTREPPEPPKDITADPFAAIKALAAPAPFCTPDDAVKLPPQLHH